MPSETSMKLDHKLQVGALYTYIHTCCVCPYGVSRQDGKRAKNQPQARSQAQGRLALYSMLRVRTLVPRSWKKRAENRKLQRQVLSVLLLDYRIPPMAKKAILESQARPQNSRPALYVVLCGDLGTSPMRKRNGIVRSITRSKHARLSLRAECGLL